jgi:hypothetical protein
LKKAPEQEVRAGEKKKNCEKGVVEEVDHRVKTKGRSSRSKFQI